MRRKNQSQRRNANPFNLKPVPKQEVIQVTELPEVTFTTINWDTEPFEELVPEPTTPIYIRMKPSGSNAWPWNKKLPCCGKIEKQCTCGDARYYEVQE